MPLPPNFPFYPPQLTDTGIGVFMTPGSNFADMGGGISASATTFQVELQRAPDLGGLPDVNNAQTIATLPPLFISGTNYLDKLPQDGNKRYYRYRFVRTGWNPGPYTQWTRGAIPVPLVQVPSPDNGNPGLSFIPYNPIPTVGSGSVAIDAGSGPWIATHGPIGRSDVVLNGDFEQGLSYWVGYKFTSPLQPPLIINPTTAVETTSPFQGLKSVKWTADSSLDTFLAQSDASRDGNSDGYFNFSARCKVGEVYRGRFAAKASATGKSLTFFANIFGPAKTFQTSLGVTTVSPGTSYAEYDGVVVVPAGADGYIIPVFSSTTHDGTTVFTVDDVHLFRISPILLGVWHQDTTVAASQTNVQLIGPSGSTTRGVTMTSPGVIAGVVIQTTSACTNGTLSVDVFKNGSSMGYVPSITVGQSQANGQANGAFFYVPGDKLDIRVTTTGTWTPTANNLDVYLYGGY